MFDWRIHTGVMHWTEITQRLSGPIVVMDLRGVLTLSEEDRRLLPAIAGLIDQGRRAFLLNLQHLSYIDSPGIGEIVGAYTRVTRQGGTLKLCNASPRVMEVLRATNLDGVLESFDDEAGALRAMTHTNLDG
jgi:anti-sigma B factor antagonist